MSTKYDASLDPGEGAPTRGTGIQGQYAPRRTEEERKTQSPGWGARKPREYQPGQLDLVARYWNRVAKPVGSWGG